MQKVWKWTLEITGEVQEITMPAGAEPVHVAEQNGDLCLWALVDPTAESRRQFVEVVGTGHSIPSSMTIRRKHVGTALVGPFVWHVFLRQ